ncbi:MAG: DUF4440 domain-containing protein [Melioribacteraceae bacterium]|nr:DUF4440 domain-containing protein [Melioribacteraceae bacterium]
MKILIVFLLGCTILLMNACEKQIDTKAETEKIKVIVKEFDEANMSGDIDKFVSLYTEDAISMPQHESVRKGIDAIRDYHQSYHEQNNVIESKNISEEVIICGDWAIERGTYTQTSVSKSGGEASQDEGKYLVIYQRLYDGQFKIHLEIWNSDLPIKK